MPELQTKRICFKKMRSLWGSRAYAGRENANAPASLSVDREWRNTWDLWPDVSQEGVNLRSRPQMMNALMVPRFRYELSILRRQALMT